MSVEPSHRSVHLMPDLANLEFRGMNVRDDGSDHIVVPLPGTVYVFPDVATAERWVELLTVCIDAMPAPADGSIQGPTT